MARERKGSFFVHNVEILLSLEEFFPRATTPASTKRARGFVKRAHGIYLCVSVTSGAR